MRTIDADEFKHTISSGMCTDSITFSILLEVVKGNMSFNEATDKIICAHINEVNRLIDDAPTIEKSQEEWTPVTEGLPKRANESYLVTVDYGELGLCVGHRFYLGKGKWNDPCVIAWQPLPEPYKKGEENGKL